MGMMPIVIPTFSKIWNTTIASTPTQIRVPDRSLARVAMRHSRMSGRNFQAHQDRQNHDAPEGGAAKADKPLWERLTELKMPLLMIFGREDRAHAGERAELLKQMHPELNLHIVNGCKHMVHWDAFDDLMRLGVLFLKS